MKIYFTSAISKVDPNIRKNYQLIIKTLEDLGHTVIASHLEGKDENVLASQSEQESLAIQKKMSKWKKQANLVVVEGSTPSFGVGQEITEAINDNKQVIILYLKGKKPHILKGLGENSLYLEEYDRSNLKEVLKTSIEFAQSRSDTRFNFFISPEIGAYLDWISKNKRIPRAVYLRRLIEEDMKNNKEYNGEE